MHFDIPKDQVEKFVIDALSLPHHRLVQTLDPDESFQRKTRRDISLQLALMYIRLADDCLFRFTKRKTGGLLYQFLEEEYWEFCATGEVENLTYFVWINLPVENGNRLVEKYFTTTKNDEQR